MMSFGLQAQTHKIESGKTVTIDVAGVTAAYSLDPSCADAEAQDGALTVTARRHGTTHVVAVTPAGPQTLEIVVVDAAVKRSRAGFDPLLLPTGTEYGSVSSRYDSTSDQLQSEIDFSRRQDQTTIRAHLVGTRMLGSLSSGESRTGLPAASYEISTPNRDLTFLDKYLDESPLAITGAIVRGLHYREGNWLLHAGYTSVASFQGLLLPARAEGVVEVGYRRPLTPHSSLTGSFYDFMVPAADRVGRSGTVALLSYAYRPRDGFQFNLEAGWSRGAAASARLEYRGDRDHLRASVRYAPPAFAALGSNNLKGFHADLTWTRQLTGRLSSDVSFYDNKLTLPGIEQSTANAAAKIQYRIGTHWSIFGGGTGSSYATTVPPRPPVRTINAPAGLGFNSRHFGAQGQYQFSKTTNQDSGGHQYRVTVSTGAGILALSAFGEQQTQAPTLSFLLAQTPGLQQALDLLGLQATSIQDVNEILRDNAELFAAGYIQGAAINLAPRRRQAGGSMNLMGHGWWPQVSYNFIYNDNLGLTSSAATAIHTLLYNQRIGPENISLSYSLVGTKTPGMAASYLPMFSVGWRHESRSVPMFLIPEHHGTITGVVFRDDDSKGAYEPGMPLIESARVVLDDSRRTETRADGSFRFTGVRQGKHHLVVSYKSSKPTFFSTQSEIDVAEDATVHFGIGFSLSGLGGRLINDAGQGIPAVTVQVRNKQQRWSTSTDGDGSFFLRQLQEGDYEVTVDEESVPPGYLISELAPQTVNVAPSTPGRAQFNIRALRSIAGRVVVFDKDARKVLPVARMQVQLKETRKVSVTDALGQYVFRDLPAGSYTVAVSGRSGEVKRMVNLPATPLAQSNIDLQLPDEGLLPPDSPKTPNRDDQAPASVAGKPADRLPEPAPPAQPAAVVVSPAPPSAAAPSSAALVSRAGELPDTRGVAARPSGKSFSAPELSGRQKISQNRYAEAIVDLTEAIRIAPRSATAYNARGFVWLKLHQFRRALDDFDHAISLNTKYANAYHNRAVVRRSLGDWSGAESDRRREAGLNVKP